MLSRRDKLLVQPWADRRFKDHRSKVRSALPAIDDRTPPSRPHVALKLKKCQRELDRKLKIQTDNYSLLQRLNAIMKVNRLDNHWPQPLPNFQHKVGLFYDAESLNSRVTARSEDSPAEPYGDSVKCYACDVRKIQSRCFPSPAAALISFTMKKFELDMKQYRSQIQLPCIFSNDST